VQSFLVYKLQINRKLDIFPQVYAITMELHNTDGGREITWLLVQARKVTLPYTLLSRSWKSMTFLYVVDEMDRMPTIREYPVV